MPNTNVPATAGGMPAINRRRMLLGLAAASTAAATVAATVPAAALTENPELVRLGDMLPSVEADYASAIAGYRAVVKEWSPRWPELPEALVGRGDETARDFTGWGIQRVNCYGEMRCVQIATVDSLQGRISWIQGILKSKTIDSRKIRGLTRPEWEAEMDESTALLKVARRYEQKCETVRRASGLAVSREHKNRSFTALADLIGETMGQQPVGMVGVMIQAQALGAWGRHGDAGHQMLTPGAITWGADLAASVLRLAEGGVS